MSVTLKSSNAIAWSGDVPSGLNLHQVHFGPDPKGLGSFEIAIAVSDHSPSATELKQLHKSRLQGRDSSLVVAVVHGETVWMFGPDTTLQPQKQAIDSATRHLQAALDEGDALQATKRFLSLSDAQSQTQMPGVRNRGLFATYHLRENTKKRADWSKFQDDSARIVRSRSRQLIEDLGFVVTETANHTLVLNDSADATRAVALLLDESESFENESPRFHSSPVAWGLSIAAERGVPWLIMLRKEQIRLYPARDGVGVGQKGQTETYLELDLAGLGEEYMGLLTLIFSAEALGEKGSAQELLDESVRYATALGTRLRERIYERVVPDLAKAVALEMRKSGRELDATGLQDAYRATLRILFRFLFQAYAEDRGLLPAGRNSAFDEHSLTLFASKAVEGRRDYGEETGIWDMLQEVWEAIDVGNPDWRVPAYNGGLFGSDPELRPYGALIKELSLPDSVIGPALEALLIDKTEDDVTGMVDFRSLSVREFGTIYEGLLESSLSLADTDLTLDANGTWLPAGEGDTVEAHAGEPYFHNTSGERKATGSYFTPDFIVDHLIERSIDPSLDDHLARIKALIDKGKENEAAKNFFDYRVADLAMGSAHFLVAAVDRIESKMRSFLAQPGQEIAGVSNELERLAEAARKALGDDLVAIDDIDDAVLLRRQIARRCVYGIDINPLAVELSRLALWIHTFVPGLPMSTLDHNLVCGNSLTGIGSVEEGLNALMPDREKHGTSLFDGIIENSLRAAKVLLEDLANADEADKSQALNASYLAERARKASERAEALFDVAVAARNGVISTRAALTEDELEGLHSDEKVRALVSAIAPAHLPFLFPEVFVRENPGFDALLGNPPFQETTVEELDFWNLRFKGMKSMSSSDQIAEMERLRTRFPLLLEEYLASQTDVSVMRRALASGPFPGMGVGDPDLYKAFAWRFFGLCREGGLIGLVMPNSIWNTKGSSEWRRSFFTSTTSEIVLIINTKSWAFENVNPGYRFSFVSARKLNTAGHTKVRGIFDSKEAFAQGIRSDAPQIRASSLLDADEFCTLPSLDGSAEVSLWSKLLLFPGLSDGRLAKSRDDIRCAPATEIHVSEDGRKKGIFTSRDTDYPVYNHLNVLKFKFDKSVGAFNFADFDEYVQTQEQAAKRLVVRKDSALSLWGKERLEQIGHPIRSPRIVIRDVIHASNQKKVWAALAPANTLLTNKAPYLVFSSSKLEVAAYVLGVLNSGVVDWFGSLKIGLNLNFFILYSLPIPEYLGSNRQARIAELAARLAISQGEDFGDWVSFGDPIELIGERKAAETELEHLVCEEFGLESPEKEIIYGSGNEWRVTKEDLELVYFPGGNEA